MNYLCGITSHGYVQGENECRICKRDASEAGSKSLRVKQEEE